ncbi:MAG: 6-phosphogluconolactonase [Candidatus Nanopelagicaceae bacterium]|nr:6-phosphogluconolactonase [Candidatus Nanopelagicaceae bacterium]
MNEYRNRVIKISSSLDELCTTVMEMVSTRIHEEIARKGSFHLAMTGGIVGGLVCEKLISHWNAEPKKVLGLHIWWSDERFVEVGSSERNAHVLLTRLRSDSGIHIHHVLASDSGVSLEVAASRYAFDLAGIAMDLTLLGVGADGHVASLFPGATYLERAGDVTAVRNAPKSPPMRVSFSMEKINESTSVWLLASGISKRDAVAKILVGDTSIPATLAHGQKETLLFVDRDSFASE